LSAPATSEAPTFDELIARIRATFAELPFSHAELITHGEDNLVVALDRSWIVRFPRNAEYRARFAAELNLLHRLRPLSPLAVPNYEKVAPDQSFGAYRRIAGREMTPTVFAAMVPHAQQVALTSLSRFLLVLHGLPADTITQPDGTIARTWSGEQFAALYRGMRRARIARVVPAALLARFDAFHDAFETLAPGPARLVHDDISDDHILVDDSGRIAGIVDFSDASYGDAAIDFAFFWRLGESSVDRVLGDYALADAALKSRSHWTFVRYMINQLSYGATAKWQQSVAQTLAELEPHLTKLGF
jgi:aminoglycoside phosphotransferase (APT) family kinase protein